jgi:hypothetical protein
MRTLKWLLMALTAGGASACSSTDNQPSAESATGEVQINLTTVPTDVNCLKVSVSGPRALTQLIDVTPGGSTSYTIGRLPVGIVTISAEAYSQLCNSVVTGTVASYVTDAPQSVRVDSVDVNTITLNLIRNGRIQVGVDFENGPTPYLVPVLAGITTKPLFTVGDTVNAKANGTPYRMVGIPDGLGAFDNGDGTFTLLMNHEITNPGGIPRDHSLPALDGGAGTRGAFVSKWKIRKSDLTVLNGSDLIQNVARFDVPTATYLAPAKGVAFSRFCSADLAPLSAWYDAASGLGFNGQLYLNGEEVTGGPAWAHALNGTSWELPRLGKQAWENLLANPATGLKTVVIGTDDTTPGTGVSGQVYLYIGTKTATGSPVQMAGLTNGTLYGIAVTGFANEGSGAGIPSGTAFTAAALGNVETQSGATLESSAIGAGVTGFNRPEDGAWDPLHPQDFYFVTTNAITAPSRLWRLRFNDVNNLQNGGTIDMLLDGTEGQLMFDNIAVDKKGHVYLLEDVGNDPHIGKVWRYTIATDQLTMIAQHNPNLFTPGASQFLTQDEEASGIIDASDVIGPGWFLVDVQAHYATDSELVEGGQLLAIFDPAAQ